MKYLVIVLALFVAACGSNAAPPYTAGGFCLENPTVGIPTSCESILLLRAGDM
ncbi:MAG: hypothetical protein HN478_16390 [Rhodospirillaceae bacterium]|jgi:hypothetical protein|nr:hypothetical protein [Rhodospirillaceae bacterium]MBT5193671.1 hypothetical protein [Rhodospirillaceae bacterium]